jgi:hypothetical protein
VVARRPLDLLRVQPRRPLDHVRHAADGTGADEIVMADSARAVPFHISVATC